jgi:AraC family transcriptional regulator
LVFFQMSPRVPIECRIAGRTLRHEVDTGSLAICPAGVDCSAETDSSIDVLVIGIAPEKLTLAAAEQSALDARLNERMSGCDENLLGIARLLASESANGYPDGPPLWNEATRRFIGQMVSGHSSVPETPLRGRLSRAVLQKISDHILAHLRADRGRRSRGIGGLQRVSLLARVCPLGRHDAAMSNAPSPGRAIFTHEFKGAA